MDVTIAYPTIRRRLLTEQRIRGFFFWLFLAAAVACGIVNLCVGGKAWSLVVVWSLWLAWSGIITRPLVENHWMGRTTHLLLYVCVLLVLIDVLLAPALMIAGIAVLRRQLLVELQKRFHI